MRYIAIMILGLLLLACSDPEPNVQPKKEPTVEVPAKVPTEAPEVPTVIEVPELITEPEPPALIKEDIVRNEYQETDASKLTGLQSLKYDLYFRQSMKWHMPYLDWQWLKAQCWQESRFNPKAVSPVGAGGVCQFMPGTWDEVPDAMKEGREVWDARTNIEAAAWYDNRMYNFWKSPRPMQDRINLMLASYNAGAGNLHKSQIKCNDPSLYHEIIVCLPDITGHHAKEPIDYVEKINGFKEQLHF